MAVVSFEAWADCSGCARRVNVRALVREAACEDCDARTEVEAAWRTLGLSVLDEGDWKAEPLHVVTSRSKAGVECPVCERVHGEPTEDVACECGEQLSWRAAQAAIDLGWPQGTRLVAEDLVPSSPRGAAVVVPCAKCAADLDIDGSSRSVECRYCHAKNALDDAAWRHLHPMRRIRRFSVVFDYKALRALRRGARREATQHDHRRRETHARAQHESLQQRATTLDAKRPRTLPAWAPTPMSRLGWFATLACLGSIPVFSIVAASGSPGAFGLAIAGAIYGFILLTVELTGRRTARVMREGSVVLGVVRNRTSYMMSKNSPVVYAIAYAVDGHEHVAKISIPDSASLPQYQSLVGLSVEAQLFLAVDRKRPSKPEILAVP